MNEWLLLVLSLPTENASARMRAWRALKASGAAVLRDGVYLMPAGAQRRGALADVARDIDASGGISYLLDLAGPGAPEFLGLFDRTEDYRKLAADIAACRQMLDGAAQPEVLRQARKLRKAFEMLTAIDFFPGEAQRQVAGLLAELDRVIQARISPDEPTGRTGTVSRCRRDDFQGRLWATRRKLWVDRLASAWLIQRFIDARARFVWLAAPADCPPEALGFDFDGAVFSHTETAAGVLVTFETLLTSFGLEADGALARIARIVHCLDVGGLPVAEAAGLEGVLRGMRARLADDDALLAEGGRLFDDLYRAFRDERTES